MAGKVKSRIRKARESGNEGLAVWLENREIHRAEGLPLWEYDRDNPKPDGDVSKSTVRPHGEKVAIRVNDGRDIPDSIKYSGEIPELEKKVLDDIRQSKKKLKEKCRRLADSNSIDELKTTFKVLKRLDNEEKKLVYRYDFEAFDRDLFSDLQDRVETAQFHFDMIGLYENHKRACVICPRGHAKSTTARKYILHQILYNKTQYTVIVGASEDMAGQNLRWVRDQLIENPKIVEIYGYLKNKDKWADTEFQTNTKIKVSAKGASQKIRGSNERGRPDLIYIDDLEEDEGVVSKDRRAKLSRWFKEALLPAKSKNGRIIITGTILHLDSLLNNISKNKVRDHIDWKVLWYQAINVDDKTGDEYALWEELKPIDELKALREADPQTFAQEYQNSPTSGAMAVFHSDQYQHYGVESMYIDPVDGSIRINNKLLNLVITTDLAVSEKEGSDYTVFMVSGMDEDSNLYVLDYDRFRSSDPYHQIDMLFDLSKKWGCSHITMEEIAFQTVFKKLFEREMDLRGEYFYIQEMKRKAMKKIFRLKALKGPISKGLIYWQHCHVHIEEELNQVTATSLGVHDDVIDALSDAWECLIEIHEETVVKEPTVNSYEWIKEEYNVIPWHEQLQMQR